MTALPHWLNVAVFFAYAAGVFWIVRRLTQRHLRAGARRLILWALWLGVPLMVVPFSRQISDLVGALLIVTIMSAGFAILLTPEQEASSASR